MSCVEIARCAELDPSAVRAALFTLRRDGRVRMIGKGPASRYERVPGARCPPDKRGKHHRSLANLEPPSPEVLIVRRMRAAGKVWHPPRVAGIELERCWG